MTRGPRLGVLVMTNLYFAMPRFVLSQFQAKEFRMQNAIEISVNHFSGDPTMKKEIFIIDSHEGAKNNS